MSATTGKTGGSGGVVPRLCLAAFVRKGKFIARNTEGSHESGGPGHPGCICVCIVRSLSFKKIRPLFEPWLAKNVTLYPRKCQKSQNVKSGDLLSFLCSPHDWRVDNTTGFTPIRLFYLPILLYMSSSSVVTWKFAEINSFLVFLHHCNFLGGLKDVKAAKSHFYS